MNRPSACALHVSMLVVVTIAMGAEPLSAQQRADTSRTARVDQVFARFDRTDSPGCAMAIMQNGKLAYTRGYGMANLELGVAISPQSVFDIGSTSKQFTAMAVMLLAADGKLSLDDEVRKYIPELPDYGTKLTIRHILTHTSGIRDYLTLWALAEVDDADLTNDADALRLIVRQRALNFTPGSQFLYSNSGFFLASQIVRRVSGQTLAQFAAERIFSPLGMRHTRFNDDHLSVIPQRATGYSPRAPRLVSQAGPFATSMSNFEQTGDGAVQTSVEDLILWDENFYTGKVGGRAVLDEMQRVAMLSDGSATKYGLGLFIDSYRGQRVVSHGGAWAGYRAELLRFPDQHTSVACLCNLATSGPSALAKQVADIWLGDALGPAAVAVAPAGQSASQPRAPVATWTPTPRELAAYAGDYFSEEIGTTYTLRAENGALRVMFRRSDPAALVGRERDVFGLQGMTVRFTRAGGKITGFSVDAGRTKDLRFVRVR